MERAVDLEEVVLRYYDAVSSGDSAFMAEILSTRSEVLIIGTDPDEWWSDPAVINATLKGQAEAGVAMVAGALTGYAEGTIGWIADRPSFILPGGVEIPSRFTAVFRREEGAWKMVQAHASLGVANDEVVEGE